MSAASPASDPLDTLLAGRRDLWRGRRPSRLPALSTGHRVLDEQLPDGGWPCARLIELMIDRPGGGEMSLLLPMLAELTCREQPVILVTPPLVPCPQALLTAGLNLSALTIIRHRAHALWAAEQCLKSGLCGAVVLWPQKPLQPRQLRRLQLAAENGTAPAFIVHGHDGAPQPASMTALRLAIRPGPSVELLRARGGCGRNRIRLTAEPPGSIARP
ncbi:translesion DNA synthesis-associated protein ImuA [Wenzhouxiangella sp. AB-CW3]|uniref:translesion DNA synthesis-associated protein ImuA n=1 Tax=Wenzhouxiangella sp. AB-CW3 TaxID=2771012 RepID=UPI00168AA2DB|nr:translesion DNA synthesis-associated protein ImuA [Wenzhouxiangella sp. AB-CW3]QOC23843.1 translesion DNA synthesis-associated protein ImuA [Wenzhouxiangella sp. AB-CW3]